MGGQNSIFLQNKLTTVKNKYSSVTVEFLGMGVQKG
jgi:hypothetical protein